MWSWHNNESTDQPNMVLASIDDGTLLGTEVVLQTWESAPMPTLLYAHGTYAATWHEPPDPFNGETDPQLFFSVSP